MKIPNWILAILYAIIGLSLYAYLMYGEMEELPSFNQDKELIGMVSFISILVGFLMRALSHWLQKWLTWQKYLGFRFLAELVMRTLLVCLVLAGATIARLESFDTLTIQHFLIEHQTFFLEMIVISSFANIFFTIISFTFFTYHHFAIAQIQSVELKRKQLQLQFDMLRSQLSPHYLFNCLNTISNLAYKDANLAEEFIRRFAQTYQYVLNTHKKQLIPLSEEIEFVKAFVFLLQTRFSDSIQMEIDLPKTLLSSPMPPLTLQILVENAVKHNVISETSPLQIRIYHEGNQLCLQNSLSEKPKQVASLKVGLQNIQKRYEYFTLQKLEITQSGVFEVKLPVLENHLAHLKIPKIA